YAILSHTWGTEEVTFDDINRHRRVAMKLEGCQKVRNFCRIAANDGWEYAWIDTCCINKSDVNELSDAINSMFRWYERTEVCYAFLVDVPRRYSPDNVDKTDQIPWHWYFRSSRWFTRGWTLQELLAPPFLLFFAQSWNGIGSRESLTEEVSIVTGISPDQLLEFRSCSVATKLSWAAHRQTTKVEDRAYSLLGLMGMNMPMIYGEGENAFIRLQHELIRKYDDETVPLWEGTGRLLAKSPDDFSKSKDLIVWPSDKERRGFAITKAGLAINAELLESCASVDSNQYRHYAIQLNCARSWPALKSYRSPMILRLLSTEGSASTFFHRSTNIASGLETWRDANFLSTWRSLGRRDIIVAHSK
ncbi:heterokaryon incompatibility protein-domain-containing protein, partial [Podospora australis]